MVELPADISARIDDLCEKAQAYEESGELNSALRCFAEALAVLPQPESRWAASAWLHAAIGDCQFQLGNFASALDHFRIALIDSEDVGNPFLRLRRGQALFELGDTNKALEELAAAYMLEGREIFDGEDPKYFELIKKNLRPPASGEW